MTVTHPVKGIPAFYGTRSFTALLTTACLWFLTRITQIQDVKIHLNITLQRGLAVSLQVFQTKFLYAFLIFPRALLASPISFSLIL